MTPRRFGPTRARLVALCALGIVAGGPGARSAGAPPPRRDTAPELVAQVSSKFQNGVAFAPDGLRALTAGDDGVARLWDVRTGDLLRGFATHATRLHAVAFAPDGLRALTAGDDGQVMIWDVATGAPLRTLAGHQGPVRSAAFVPGGRRVLSGGEDGTVRLWDADTGAARLLPGGHAGEVNAVAPSPDGHRALTAGADGTARLWDLDTGRAVRVLGEHQGPVLSVAFARDAPRGLTGGFDGTARYWDLETGVPLKTFGPPMAGACLAVALSPDGRLALTGGRGQTAHLWDVAAGHLRTLEPGPGTVYAVAFSPDGRQALTGGGDREAILWDVATGRRAGALGGRVAAVSSVAFSRDGHRILIGDYGGAVTLWDGPSGQLLRSFKGPAARVQAVASSLDGGRALIGSNDGTARLIDLQMGSPLHTLPAHSGVVTSVALSGDGRRAATGGQGGVARLWDAKSGRLLQTLPVHLNSRRWPALVVHSVAFSPDSGRVLTAGMDGAARLWDAGSGRLLRSFEGHAPIVYAVAFAPDGLRALTGDERGDVRIWAIGQDTPIRAWPAHDEVAAIAVSPDGGRVATGGRDGLARLWDAASGKFLANLQGHASAVHAIAFAPDGRRVLTGSYDGTARLWDAESGDLLCTLVGFDDGTWAAVSPDGRFDASRAGHVEGLHWVVGLEPIRLDQLKSRYYDPGLLAKVLGLRTEPPREVESLAGVTLPPDVEVTPPDAGDPRGAITITVTDRGGGIGRVVVKVNGIEIDATARGLAPDSDPRREVARLSLPMAGDPRLVPGRDDKIEVTAYNAEGYLRSRGSEIELVDDGGPPADPELWAVVVGISDYNGDRIDLHFAAKDAEAMAKALEVAGRRLFGADRLHITVLSTERPDPGSRPSKAAIVRALEAAHAARPTDILVVYLAGHGVAPFGQDDYYYLTADAQSLVLGDPDSEVRRRDALSSEDLAKLLLEVYANKRVIILDTCAAGQAFDSLAHRRAVTGDQVRALDRVRERTGFHMLAGAAADAASYEASCYAQGLLTYSLLEGMTGPALEGSEVDVYKLFEHAIRTVPVLARGIGGIQEPRSDSSEGGGSFPIGMVTAEDVPQIPRAKKRPMVLRVDFQEDVKVDDVLELGARVNSALQDLWARGGADAPVFLNSPDGPAAYRPRGRYWIDGEAVSVTLPIFLGRENVGQVEARGMRGDVDALAQTIVTELVAWLARRSP